MPLVKTKATLKPILEVLSDGNVHRDHEIQELVARKLRLTPSERALRMLNGRGRGIVYKNRTAWGLVYGQNTRYLPDTEPWIRKVGGSGGTELYEITPAGRKALDVGLADHL